MGGVKFSDIDSNAFTALKANDRLDEIFGPNDINLTVNPYAQAVDQRVKSLFNGSTKALNPYTLVSSYLAAEIAVAAVTKDNVFPDGGHLDKISANISNLTVGGAGAVALSIDSNGNLDTGGNINVGSLQIGGDSIVSNVDEINILSGITASTQELNTLSGIQSTTAELNKLYLLNSTRDELELLHNAKAGLIENGKAVIYGTAGEVDVTKLKIKSVDIISTANEINILSGVTADKDELNKLDGLTASTQELNTLSGIQSTTSELNKLHNLNSTTDELELLHNASPGSIENGKAVIYGIAGEVDVTKLQIQSVDVTSSAAELNKLHFLNSTTAELELLNTSAPGKVVNGKAVVYGNDGEVNVKTLQINGSAVTASVNELNILNGLTASTDELNTLSGIQSTTTELNILSGVKASTAELNLLDGSVAGQIVNDKAVVYGNDGEVNVKTLQINGSTVTASVNELNILSGVTADTNELNLLDGSVAGQIVNEKAVIYSNTGTIKVNKPVANSEVANKEYVDNVAQGLTVKEAVKVASVHDVTLANLVIGFTLDGIVLEENDRVLIKNQSDPTTNGIYIISSQFPARSPDFNSNENVRSGAFVFIQQGSVGADTGFVLNSDIIDVGTNPLEFTQFSRAGVVHIDGDSGVTVTQQGNTFTVKIGQDVSNTSNVTFDSVKLNSNFDRNGSEQENSSPFVRNNIEDLYAKMKIVDRFLQEINNNIKFDTAYTALKF